MWESVRTLSGAGRGPCSSLAPPPRCEDGDEEDVVALEEE